MLHRTILILILLAAPALSRSGSGCCAPARAEASSSHVCCCGEACRQRAAEPALCCCGDQEPAEAPAAPVPAPLKLLAHDTIPAPLLAVLPLPELTGRVHFATARLRPAGPARSFQELLCVWLT